MLGDGQVLIIVKVTVWMIVQATDDKIIGMVGAFIFNGWGSHSDE